SHEGSPPEIAKVSLDQRLGDRGQQIKRGTNSEHDERDGEYAARGAERLDLTIADRRDGRHGHEQGVERRHALDRDVADRTGSNEEDEAPHREPQTPRRAHRPSGWGVASARLELATGARERRARAVGSGLTRAGRRRSGRRGDAR